MAEERKIIIESGNGSLDDVLNIAAAGIAALIFQSMGKQENTIERNIANGYHSNTN